MLSLVIMLAKLGISISTSPIGPTASETDNVAMLGVP